MIVQAPECCETRNGIEIEKALVESSDGRPILVVIGIGKDYGCTGGGAIGVGLGC